MAEWTDRLKDQKEWNKVIVFDSSANTIASHGVSNVDSQDLKEFLKAWDSRDDTVGKGLVLSGKEYEVHRWYDALVYGRRGNVEKGEGICLMRKKKKGVSSSNAEDYTYAVITYVFPTISSRAIPQLVEFGDKYCNAFFFTVLAYIGEG